MWQVEHPSLADPVPPPPACAAASGAIHSSAESATAPPLTNTLEHGFGHLHHQSTAKTPIGHSCPFNTSHGPSHHAIVVCVKHESAPADLVASAPRISSFIDSMQSPLLVESFRPAYSGMLFAVTKVPFPVDLSRIETFIRTLVPAGSTVQCEVPSSHSFCKLVQVLFL